MKKKFRDSAISREDLEDAIASRIELAFKEQQSTLNSVVNSAVKSSQVTFIYIALLTIQTPLFFQNLAVRNYSSSSFLY